MLTLISVKFPQSTLTALDKLATIRGTTRSKVLRALVDAWVSDHEKFIALCDACLGPREAGANIPYMVRLPVGAKSPALETLYKHAKENT